MTEKNRVVFRRNGLVMQMEETDKGGAKISLSYRGITDEIVVPENRMVAFSDAFDLAAITLQLWGRK